MNDVVQADYYRDSNLDEILVNDTFLSRCEVRRFCTVITLID